MSYINTPCVCKIYGELVHGTSVVCTKLDKNLSAAMRRLEAIKRQVFKTTPSNYPYIDLHKDFLFSDISGCCHRTYMYTYVITIW